MSTLFKVLIVMEGKVALVVLSVLLVPESSAVARSNVLPDIVVGAFMSTACTDWVAAVLALPATSMTLVEAKSTVMSPSKLLVGVIVTV